MEDRPSNDDIVLSLKNQPTSTNRSPRKKSVALKQLKRQLEVNMKLRRPQTSSTDASATSETSTVSTPCMNSTTSSRTTSSTTTKNHGNRERQDRPSATPVEITELWEIPYDPINETINGYNGFVALVTNEDEGERKTLELPPAIQKLIEEFEDVLPDDLPDQLPPYRTHQHEIIEEPGSKPTFRAPYRLSPTELADMKKQIEYLLDK
ncbi:unnamed protein product [Closterium sp. NIES-53]